MCKQGRAWPRFAAVTCIDSASSQPTQARIQPLPSLTTTIDDRQWVGNVPRVERKSLGRINQRSLKSSYQVPGAQPEPDWVLYWSAKGGFANSAGNPVANDWSMPWFETSLPLSWSVCVCKFGLGCAC